MMSHSPSSLSKITIHFHWLIALGIIGMLAFGIYIEEFVPGRLADGTRNPFRGELMFFHKSFGAIILLLAGARVGWRFIEGWPEPASIYKRIEVIAAKATHWLLLLGTLIMPLSGIIMSQAAGRAVSVFGLFNLPTIVPESKAIGDVGHVVHEFGAWILIGVIAFHIAGALKHHVIDKDETLKRMLGS